MATHLPGSLQTQYAARWEPAAPPPDVWAFLQEHPSASRSEIVEVLLADQRLRHEIGQSVRLEEYLDRHLPLRGDSDAVLDLICQEVALREQRGETPNKAEYLGRFPGLADQLSLQFHVDDVVRGTSGQLETLATTPDASADRTVDHVAGHSTDRAALPAELGEGGFARVYEAEYEFGREIARGGMGVVYVAFDRVLGREVAIKTILPGRDVPEAVARFESEARITARLSHPGVPPVHALGHLSDGRPFLAMKLIRGRTLADKLAARDSLDDDLSELASVFERICQAIAFAHSQGMIHRDLKPQNVMVGAFGEVQVMDWGLAKRIRDKSSTRPVDEQSPSEPTAIPNLIDGKLTANLTQPGAIMGTLAYMSPEQARGETDAIDARSDVFALGAILCKILIGRAPYEGRDAHEVWRRAAAGDIANVTAELRIYRLGLESRLAKLAIRCLAPVRDNRPNHAGEVAAAVNEAQTRAADFRQSAEVVQVRAEAAGVERRAKRLRRSAFWLAAVAVILGLGMSGLGVFLSLDSRDRYRIASEAGEKEEHLRVEAVHGQFQLALDALVRDPNDPFPAGVAKSRRDRLSEILRQTLADISPAEAALGYASLAAARDLDREGMVLPNPDWETAVEVYEPDPNDSDLRDLFRRSPRAALAAVSVEWFSREPKRSPLEYWGLSRAEHELTEALPTLRNYALRKATLALSKARKEKK